MNVGAGGGIGLMAPGQRLLTYWQNKDSPLGTLKVVLYKLDFYLYLGEP